MKNEEINEWSRKLLPVVVVFFIFLLIIYCWLASIKFIPSFADAIFPIDQKSPMTYGDVGELFGAVSGLFSGLMFFGLLILFWRQQRYFKLQSAKVLMAKKDYDVNRVNNLIIDQVKRIDNLVDSLFFQDHDLNEYKGSTGIDFFNAVLRNEKIGQFKNGESVGVEEEELIFNNFSDLKKLLLVLAQSNQTIEDQLFLSKIGEEDKEKLYAVFLRNLGAAKLALLRKLECFTSVILLNDEKYKNTGLCFENPIFILSELSAGFFHQIESNCDSRLVRKILPEPI